MIDSHAHLDMIERPTTEVVADAEQAGVHRVLTIGIDGSSCRVALQLAEDFPQVRVAVGRHPNAATGFDDADRAELAARFDATRRRGDTVHRREEARYALEVEDDPARALALARANFAVQKEPADVRLLADAARAAGAKP